MVGECKTETILGLGKKALAKLNVISDWPALFLSIAGFLFFTDMCIYWIHRVMHHPKIYKVS